MQNLPGARQCPTFASPLLQEPLALDADIVRRQSTSTVTAVIGGAVITNDREIAEQIAFHQNCVGAVPGP